MVVDKAVPTLETPKLFSSYRLSSGIEVPHRIVLAPLTRFRADENQVPKPCVALYYEQRASCKGLLISEATSIHEDAASYTGSPGIYSGEQINAWRTVTERVHAKGAKIFMQLWHVGRSTHSSLLNGKQPVSSSAIPLEGAVRSKYSEASGGTREAEVPRALEIHEIKEIVQQYVKAAENAIAAGFDGIEIHGANGYLIDQFLRDGVNKRTDEYGGSCENRCRFLIEILEATVSKLGQERVGVRFSPFGTYNSMSDSDPTCLYSYLLGTLSETFPRLAYVHVTSFTKLATIMDEAAQASDAALYQLRNKWTGTFILNLWRIDREKAIQVVEENNADFIAVGRDFLANPDLPLRLLQGVKLNPQNLDTFYTHNEEGYTDYPFYEE